MIHVVTHSGPSIIFNERNCELNKNDLRTTFSAVWPAGIGCGALAQVRSRNGGAVGR